MDILYPAVLKPTEEGGYLVNFVDLPDTFTEGDTLEEALFNAAEVLSGMLCAHLDRGHEIPLPSANVKDAHYIAPDAKTQAALLIRRARGERSLAELARSLVKPVGLWRNGWKTRNTGLACGRWIAPPPSWVSGLFCHWNRGLVR